MRTLVRAGIPLCDAVRMATDTPARRIGASCKGRIYAGCDADILLLDDTLHVSLVMAGGEILTEQGEERDVL